MSEKKKIRVGDRVMFRYGLAPARGVVKEDRGPIGIGGRRLYLILFDLESSKDLPIELPADEFEVVPKGVLPG